MFTYKLSNTIYPFSMFNEDRYTNEQQDIPPIKNQMLSSTEV